MSEEGLVFFILAAYNSRECQFKICNRCEAVRVSHCSFSWDVLFLAPDQMDYCSKYQNAGKLPSLQPEDSLIRRLDQQKCDGRNQVLTRHWRLYICVSMVTSRQV